eukprot:NODE_103_length_19640_cov_0.520905.p4 type:complete len:374 gc:universal NODE_103_length_19640_cov_0.520905:17034-18155(+)
MDIPKLPFELLIKCIPFESQPLINKEITKNYLKECYKYLRRIKIPKSTLFDYHAMVQQISIYNSDDIDYNLLSNLKLVTTGDYSLYYHDISFNFKRLATSNIAGNIKELKLDLESDIKCMDDLLNFTSLEWLTLPEFKQDISQLHQLRKLRCLTIKDIAGGIAYHKLEPFVNIKEIIVHQPTQQFLYQCNWLFPNLEEIQLKDSFIDEIDASCLHSVTKLKIDEQIHGFPPNLKILQCFEERFEVDLPTNLAFYSHQFDFSSVYHDAGFIDCMMFKLSENPNMLVFCNCKDRFIISNQKLDPIYYDAYYYHKLEILPNGFHHYYNNIKTSLFHACTKYEYFKVTYISDMGSETSSDSDVEISEYMESSDESDA